MKARSVWFWVIWLLVVFAVLWWFARLAAAGPLSPPIPGKHYHHRKTAFVTQGDGASLLIDHSPLPAQPKPILLEYYFAATASNVVGMSEFSNEVIFTNSIRSGTQSVTLAWNASVGTNVTYWIHKGWDSGQYSAIYFAGTNLTLQVPLAFPFKSNVVVTVTSSNAVHLVVAQDLCGPWQALNATQWIATNPPSPIYFRAIGNTNNRVFIKQEHF